ncbi:MAG: molecular chaperone HtpG [Bacteriovoracaceae bacterium]|jgi:molecular chaperone HtpG|nr:molecular chaperone HtpG [Bacteriovoracaceae bacterium]
MSKRTGSISVTSSDIFPIIKKWLYSEHDIFIRELVANASDAITKRATLGRNSNCEVPDGEIKIDISKKNNTIVITDNGVGMSEEEVEKYIASLAFSGAEEFIEKLKSEGAEDETSRDDIIGKFGLGFYSAFMVADKVEIDTLSMMEGAKSVKWSCEGETEYEFDDSTKTEIGTTITLHINKESEEFLNYWTTKSTLTRHCDFMSYPIKAIDLDAETKDDDDNIVAPQYEQINDTTPLWKKDPNTITDEQYKEFYTKLFPMESEPLFWLHLKVDHPFELQGILYFPKLDPQKPVQESNIKLYCKQVFVSDSVKDVIPEFLTLLKGVIDSTDIPLNVSRSSLQGDPNVKKISNYIIKKVAESLKKLYKKDRTKYETIWEDIGLFVKYGSISDPKFDELTREIVLFKNSNDAYVTLPEYVETLPKEVAEKLKENDVNKVVYFEKGKSDQALKRQCKDEGVYILDTEAYIDPHYMQHVEMQHKGDHKYSFSSVDCQAENLLHSDATTADDMKIKELFSKFLTPNKKEETDEPANPMAGGLEIDVKALKNAVSPAYFKVDEQMKRFQQMTKNMGNNAFQAGLKKTLVLNPNSSLIKNALKISELGDKDTLVSKICHHVQDLASLSSDGLEDQDRDQFVLRSQELISELSDLALK